MFSQSFILETLITLEQLIDIVIDKIFEEIFYMVWTGGS